jgi:hypothetical protein
MRGRVLATAGALLAPVLGWGDTADNDRRDAFEPPPSFVPDVTPAAGDVEEPADGAQRSDVRTWSAPVLLWTRGRSAPRLSALQDDRALSAPRSMERTGAQLHGRVNDATQCSDGLSRRNARDRTWDTQPQTRRRGAALLVPRPPPDAGAVTVLDGISHLRTRGATSTRHTDL